MNTLVDKQYKEILADVGRCLGFADDVSQWSDEQRLKADTIIQKSTRDFLNPARTCDTCRYWEQPEDSGFGLLNCACPKIFFAGCSDRDPGDDEAKLLDGSGYFAAISPGPKFGCVHHERKEGE